MMMRTILRNSAILAFLSLDLSGCGSSTTPNPSALTGDWFRCKLSDCTVLDSTGIRFNDDRTWQMLHQLGIPDYSPDLGYCLGSGQDDAGMYEWNGSTLNTTDGLGRDAGGGTVTFPDQETMQLTESSGSVVLFKRITPTRLTGPCT